MNPLCPICKCAQCSGGSFDLFSCPECDLVFQYPPTVSAVYDETYIHQRYDAYPTTPLMSYARMGFLKSLVPSGRILDVGYGNGAFLKACTAAGYECYGSDVHGADYGIQDITLQAALGMRWDCVTFFDSLEHFADLRPIVDLARMACTIIVSIPNRPKDFPANTMWRHFRPGEHLLYPVARSLEVLFGKEMIYSSDVEDAIRGKQKNGEANIATDVFR